MKRRSDLVAVGDLSAPQRTALMALYLALLSTLVWRGRDAEDIASNPLDSAGLIRIGFLAMAGLLALQVLKSSSAKGLPLAARRYGLYVAAVLPGVAFAVQPGLVVFRFAELLAFWVVAVALWSAFQSSELPLRQVIKAIGALCLVALIGVVVMPELALAPARGGVLPLRLQGAFPVQSANTLGTFGVFIFAYGLARSRRLVPVGVGLVAATQYRTGYIALIVVFAVFLALRRGAGGKLLLIGCLGLMPYLLSNAQIERVWTRGQSAEQVAGLNSRRAWWGEALEVAGRSPIVGTGLSSGTRFEVLVELGRSATSGIHSTWVETYVGTGILGTLALGAAALTCVAQALRLHRRTQDVLPILLLVTLSVRSVTGTTIEFGGVFLLVFLLCAVRPDAETEGKTVMGSALASHDVVASAARSLDRPLASP